jgi:hypothetical protein
LRILKLFSEINPFLNLPHPQAGCSSFALCSDHFSQGNFHFQFCAQDGTPGQPGVFDESNAKAGEGE